jgi:predicted dehydrogenase
LICGLGSIGRRHLRNLVQLGERDIVLFRTGHSTLPDDELSGYPVETDLAAALARRPDAVIVSNPTALHLDVAIPAASAGCHLLIEKPVSHNLERLDELEAAVARGGGQVLVGYQFRFHPGLQEVKGLLEKSGIGRPVSACAQWGEYLPGWHPWEDYRQSYSARADLGGGVVLTVSHPFDYLRWLLGEVREVAAAVANLGGLVADVEDTAEAILGFQAGALASIHLDYNQRPPAHALEIVGTAGTLRWDHQSTWVRWWSTASGNWSPAEMGTAFDRNEMFLAEMRHFLGLTRGRASSACGLEDGIAALEIALAVKRAAASGHTIRLSR